MSYRQLIRRLPFPSAVNKRFGFPWFPSAADCNVYTFSSANPDLLSFDAPFTGNIKLIAKSPATTGIHPDILAGLQGTFVPDEWMQYEADVTAIDYIVDATFNGVVGRFALDDVWYTVETDGSGVTIENPQQDSWTKGVCPPDWDLTPNLYVNRIFAGGDDTVSTGVAGVSPDSHTFIFDTVNFINNRDNTVTFNTEEVSGRRCLVYDLFANNGDDFGIGDSVRIEYEVTKVNAGNYAAALNLSGLSGVTVTNSNLVATGQAASTIFAEIVIDALPFTALIRIGCGTTANNTAHLIYGKPSIKKFEPVETGTYSDDYSEDYA